ncbi:hypothetical protein FISHEDRAFT_69959 [Fistulina hepatica ATCC 64428]|uniref:Uncharacterized protein n=1 Tax=Fistulina hepatica ATCC 64428 TaxID=1128425 RepID=A0A0D7AKK2_9AGAR|nr:hypothetical protein FISHEDRAFT_69959 [Fistulina hepatica ATCC 64428]
MSHVNHVCAGCLKAGFTPGGLQRHQQLSMNPNCWAEYERTMGYLPSVLPPAPELPDMQGVTLTSISFGGDHFGSAEDYHEEMFGQLDGDVDGNVDADNKDLAHLEQVVSTDDNDDKSECEDTWEPPLPSDGDPAGPGPDEPDIEEPDVEEEFCLQRAAAEVCLRAEGIFVEPFPLASAGQPTGCDLSSDEHYACILGVTTGNVIPL